MSDPYALVTELPLDEAAIRSAVDDAASGAVVVFHGVIRNHDGGEAVNALDYSGHPEAERLLRELLVAESARTGLRVAAAHRIGALQIGDAALIAAVSAAHRGEAFAAIEALVERIKQEIPIWKRQHFTSGTSEWVGI